MTVTLTKRSEQDHMFIGESSEDKPAYASTGVIFHELDTGIKYIFDGTTWRVYNVVEMQLLSKLL